MWESVTFVSKTHADTGWRRKSNTRPSFNKLDAKLTLFLVNVRCSILEYYEIRPFRYVNNLGDQAIPIKIKLYVAKYNDNIPLAAPHW